MRLRLLAVGTRMPGWVDTGIADYARRLGPELRLQIEELALAKRTAGGDTARAVADEGRRMMIAIHPDEFVVALEVSGKAFSTEELSKWLGARLQDGRDVTLLIGGPDGIAAECRKRANLHWSLSPLTLPHALVRIVIVEQLYRALSILKGHPYHRGGVT
ncbi:MAG TPA: 23S rRNA (pseudouridine(1915)-N(3))-methyltransferase RlmH [Steroidobacteraceae bacterium]|nr:23S rRNA (pseudouridine(1915)-N(3))-methyltransferase RlmH [Steroidobacteraceae bacterium]